VEQSEYYRQIIPSSFVDNGLYRMSVLYNSSDCLCLVHLHGNYTYYPESSKLRTFLPECSTHVLRGCEQRYSCNCFTTADVTSDIAWRSSAEGDCQAFDFVSQDVVLQSWHKASFGWDSISKDDGSNNGGSDIVSYGLLILLALGTSCLVVGLIVLGVLLYTRRNNPTYTTIK
jgi:hypothetical protein